jgi:hypothetical protein
MYSEKGREDTSKGRRFRRIPCSEAPQAPSTEAYCCGQRIYAESRESAETEDGGGGIPDGAVAALLVWTGLLLHVAETKVAHLHDPVLVYQQVAGLRDYQHDNR